MLTIHNHKYSALLLVLFFALIINLFSSCQIRKGVFSMIRFYWQIDNAVLAKPFHANVSFLYLLGTLFFDVVKRYRNETLVLNGLRIFLRKLTDFRDLRGIPKVFLLVQYYTKNEVFRWKFLWQMWTNRKFSN